MQKDVTCTLPMDNLEQHIAKQHLHPVKQKLTLSAPLCLARLFLYDLQLS